MKLTNTREFFSTLCFIGIAFISQSTYPSCVCADEKPIKFSHQIANILLENCVACHGPKKSEGGYRVDSFELLAKPGDSGSPASTSDKSSSGAPVAPASIVELLRRIKNNDPAERMPPDGESLDLKQIELIEKWVESGASFDGNNPGDPLFQIIPPKKYTKAPEHYPTPLPITAMSFMPNENQLIVSGYHELTLWDVENGSLIKRIEDVGERVQCIVPLPDQSLIAVGCGEPGIRGEVRVFDIKSGELKNVFVRAKDLVTDVAPRPNSTELAVASADGLLRVIDLNSQREIRTIASHADAVTCVAWSEDGKRLASGSRDKTVKIYDADSGEMLVSYSGHSAPVRNVRFLADAKEVVSSSADQKVHRWQVEGMKKTSEWNLKGEPFRMLRHGNQAWISNANKQIQQVDFEKNQLGQSMVGHSDWVLSLCIDSKSQLLASGSMDGEVRVWNLSDGSLKKAWFAKP